MRPVGSGAYYGLFHTSARLVFFSSLRIPRESRMSYWNRILWGTRDPGSLKASKASGSGIPSLWAMMEKNWLSPSASLVPTGLHGATTHGFPDSVF